MTIIKLTVWDGDYCEAIKTISKHNTELTIRKSGKKLIIKSPSIEFYLCVSIGFVIEIPIYEGCLQEDEPIEEIEEKKETKQVDNNLCNKMMKEWGLVD